MRNDRAIKDRKMHTLTADDVAGRVSRGLNKSPFSPGKLARKLGIDPRAMKNYFGGNNAPPATQLIMIMAECCEVRNEVFQLLESIGG